MLRLEDCKFKASLAYVAKACLKKVWYVSMYFYVATYFRSLIYYAPSLILFFPFLTFVELKIFLLFSLKAIHYIYFIDFLNKYT
jgi:hypothetical protein